MVLNNRIMQRFAASCYAAMIHRPLGAALWSGAPRIVPLTPRQCARQSAL